MRPSRDEAVVERKGITKVRVDIRGRAAHAGMYYAEGISAVREAAYQILALEERSRPDAVTYNCGRISGGTAENVVPETCSYTVDIRFRTADEGERAMEHLRRVTGTAHVPGAVSSVTVLGRRALCRAPKSVWLCLRICTIPASVGVWRTSGRWANGGGLGRGVHRFCRRADGLRCGDDRLGLGTAYGNAQSRAPLSAAPSCWLPPSRSSPNV